MRKVERERKKQASKERMLKSSHNQDKERVKVIDARTGTAGTMPGRELAAGMALADVDGIGPHWMELDHVQQGVIQHPRFDTKTRATIQTIQKALEDVYRLSLDEWEDGFRRDRNPHSEIAIYQYIVDVYERLTKKHKSSAEKMDIYKILLCCSTTTSRQQVLSAGWQGILSRPEAEAVIDAFYETAPDSAIKAIKVTMTPKCDKDLEGSP